MDVYSNDSVTVPDLFSTPGLGLFDNVSWLTPRNDHWKLGIQYDAICPFSRVTITPCISGAPATLTSKSATFDMNHRGSKSFTVYDEVDCTPDRQFWDEARSLALVSLTNTAPITAEAVFWSGVASDGVPVYPNLTTRGVIMDSTNQIILQPAITQITGTAGLDIVEGLDRLESAFSACYPGEGWVHVPEGLINALCARYLVQYKGGKLYTWAGNRVIVGKGYPTNIGPGGVAPAAGTGYLVMTSPVFGIRGTPAAVGDPVQSLDRSVNTLKMIAEQTFLFGWQCCAVTVQITTGGELAGLPNTPGPAV